MKNAIDWASRSGYGGGQVFAGKAIAIIGASPGAAGSGRAQLALRQSLLCLSVIPVSQLSIFSISFVFSFTFEKHLIYYYILDL